MRNPFKRSQDFIIHVPAALADTEEYKKAKALPRYGEKGAHPCPIEGCRISVEEHHKISYGYMNELKQLRRKVAELEGK